MNALTLATPTIYPPLLLTAGLVGVLALGLQSQDELRTRAARWLARLCMLAGLALLMRRWGAWSNELVRWDGTAHAWDILFFLGALPFLLVLEPASEVPVALTLGALLGMAVLACANHLFVLFLGLEILSLSTYLLIVSIRRDRRTLEAAVKYFFSGAMAAAFYLFGLAIYYAKTGTMAIEPRAFASPGVQLGVLLMLCAALFKVGAFPMQFWLPDVYEAAAPELAGFMSTTIKAAGFLLLLRLAALLPQGAASGPGLLVWLPWIAGATMTLGNFLALRQERVQRLLAYSSISHVGYLLAGVWAWLKLGATPENAATIYLYLAVYLFMNTGAFLFLKLARVAEVRQLRGYAARSPGLAAFFILILLSLAAIPPTGGFVVKFFVLWDVLRAGGTSLAAAIALNSVVGLGYYFQLIKTMTIEEPDKNTAATAQAETLGARAVLLGCAAAIVILGILPGMRSLVANWLMG